MATHALVYHVRALASNLEFIFACIGTKCVTSNEIMPVFWEAVVDLEMKFELKVIATALDKDSANRKFYKMHHLLDCKDELKQLCTEPSLRL